MSSIKYNYKTFELEAYVAFRYSPEGEKTYQATVGVNSPEGNFLIMSGKIYKTPKAALTQLRSFTSLLADVVREVHLDTLDRSVDDV